MPLEVGLMMEKTGVQMISAKPDRQATDLVEDIAVETIMALFPLALVGSTFVVGAPYGWVWGVATGVGLWTVIGAIIVVCACFLRSKA